MQDQFVQFMANKIDHNTQTLDGLNTFHGIGMIKAVTPGIKDNVIHNMAWWLKSAGALNFALSQEQCPISL